MLLDNEEEVVQMDETSQTDVTEETIVETETPESEEQEEVTVEETAAETNKTKALEAMKNKIKELTEKLTAKETPAEPVKPESKLDELAKYLGKETGELEQLIAAAKAKESGMSLEAAEKFRELEEKYNTLNAAEIAKAEENKINAMSEVVEKLTAEGIEAETDIYKFIETAKNKYGIDLKENPNPELVETLIRGGMGESFKTQIEQKTLQSIKDGETVEPDSELLSADVEAKKQKQKAEDEMFAAMFAQADKNLGLI